MSEKLLAALQKLKFGLEDLLSGEGEVFFENIFSTRHIGRVVDFMVFQCQRFVQSAKDPAYTEYRFRHIIELAIFNAWTNYRKGESAKCVEVEFGWDKGRLIVLISHVADDGIAGFVPESGVRPANEASARMLRMLMQIKMLADGLIVRHEPRTGRVQVIAFIASEDADKLAKPQYLDVSQLPAEDAAKAAPGDRTTPEALSTGNIDAFIEDEEKPVSPEASEVETVVSGAAAEGQSETRIAGGNAEEETTTLVKGSKQAEDTTEQRFSADKPEAETVTKVTGSTPEADDTITRIAGDKSPAEKEKVTRISGSASKPEKEKVVRISGGKGQATPIADLLDSIRAEAGDDTGEEGRKLISDELRKLPDAPSSSAATAAAAGRREKVLLEQIQSLKEQILGLKANASNGTAALGAAAAPLIATEPLEDEASDEAAKLLGIAPATGAGPSSKREKLLEDQNKALQEQIERLRAEQKSILDDMSSKNEQAANSLVADIDKVTSDDPNTEIAKVKKQLETGDLPDQAKQMVKGMMETVVREKAELKQKAREVDSLLRKREHEFKSKEISFRETEKSLSEQLRQKEMALEKNKETMANLSATLDKFKSTTTDAQEKVELAHKLVTVEKLLEKSKEATDRMKVRAEDLQKRLNEETGTRSTLMQENVRFKKQVEDLQRKIAESTDKSSASNSAELALAIEQRDKGQRLIEELKRQNRELQAKITQTATNTKSSSTDKSSGAKATSGNEAEFKHKLDMAEKLSKATQAELDKTKKRFEELKAQETKMRQEVSRLQGEVAKLQAELKAAGIKTATAAANSGKAAGAKGKG